MRSHSFEALPLFPGFGELLGESLNIKILILSQNDFSLLSRRCLKKRRRLGDMMRERWSRNSTAFYVDYKVDCLNIKVGGAKVAREKPCDVT